MSFLDALIWIVLCPLMAVYYRHHCHQELRLGLMKYNHHNFHFAKLELITLTGRHCLIHWRRIQPRMSRLNESEALIKKVITVPMWKIVFLYYMCSTQSALIFVLNRLKETIRNRHIEIKHKYLPLICLTTTRNAHNFPRNVHTLWLLLSFLWLNNRRFYPYH